MSYYQEGCNIDYLTRSKVLIDDPCENPERKPLRTNFVLLGFTLVNLNFGKQILVSPLWFASLLISLAITLCFRFDLLGGVVSVCAGTRYILDIIYKDTTPSYI